MLVSKVVKDTCIYADRIHDEHDAQLKSGAKALVSHGVNDGAVTAHEFLEALLLLGRQVFIQPFLMGGQSLHCHPEDRIRTKSALVWADVPVVQLVDHIVSFRGFGD